MVSAPLCWNDGYDGSGIVVGNIDTGVDHDHPCFGTRWVSGGWYDGVNGQPDPYDDHGHGTHTMGTICGGDGNGPFADDVGIAPGAQFIAAKA
jgi:bacillopeptidase F